MSSALIVVAQTVHVMAVGAVALFLPLIRADLGIDFSQAGLLAAVATISYAAMQIPTGILADRISPKKLFALGILGTNVFAILFAIGDSFAVMVAVQAVGGVFRSLMFVPGIILITRHFSDARRATAMSLFVAGGFASNVIVNLLGPLLVGPLGWRGVIVLSSVLGLVVLCLFWFFGNDPKARHDATPITGWKWVWGSPAWWLLGVAQFARLAIGQGLNFWLPAYLMIDIGLPLVVAGPIAALSAAITAPANIVGGIISDRLGRPHTMIAISLAALGLLLATIPSVTSVPLLVVVISVIAVFVQLYFAPLFAASRRTFGSRLAGLSTGFGNFCANLGGFAAILGLGILRDATGSFSVGFYCLAGVALIGLVATALLSRQPAAGVRDGSG